jgi:hypothetical protein
MVTALTAFGVGVLAAAGAGQVGIVAWHGSLVRVENIPVSVTARVFMQPDLYFLQLKSAYTGICSLSIMLKFSVKSG